ncbi:MAG: protein kinase [Archangium sp.]|nr:protein kinase [Archangium sp.]
MLRVLLALQPGVRWPLQTALTKQGATCEAIDDLSKGLRATASRFDVAVLDGTVKSLTLKWAVGELRKRNPAVRLFALGGESADVTVMDPAIAPDELARKLTGAVEKPREFGEVGERESLRPLYSVNAIRNGAPVWILGTEDNEEFEPFLALVSSLGGVPSSPLLPALLEISRGEECCWAGFTPLPAGVALSELKRLLRTERTRLSMGTVVHLARRIGEGLALLHGAHVRHGMVRPFSVWLPDAGDVMLRFGAVGELLEGDRFRNYKSMFGAAPRMDDLSPEQFRERQPGDLRTDLYQFGHMLYELLAGFSPFSSTPHDRPLSPVREHADVPPSLARVVEVMLAEDPAERPGLAEVRDVLGRCSVAPDAAGELSAARGRLRTMLGV